MHGAQASTKRRIWRQMRPLLETACPKDWDILRQLGEFLFSECTGGRASGHWRRATRTVGQLSRSHGVVEEGRPAYRRPIDLTQGRPSRKFRARQPREHTAVRSRDHAFHVARLPEATDRAYQPCGLLVMARRSPSDEARTVPCPWAGPRQRCCEFTRPRKDLVVDLDLPDGCTGSATQRRP